MAEKIQQILAKLRMRIYSERICRKKLGEHGIGKVVRPEVESLLRRAVELDPKSSYARKYRYSLEELEEELLFLKQEQRKRKNKIPA